MFFYAFWDKVFPFFKLFFRVKQVCKSVEICWGSFMRNVLLLNGLCGWWMFCWLWFCCTLYLLNKNYSNVNSSKVYFLKKKENCHFHFMIIYWVEKRKGSPLTFPTCQVTILKSFFLSIIQTFFFCLLSLTLSSFHKMYESLFLYFPLRYQKET